MLPSFHLVFVLLCLLSAAIRVHGQPNPQCPPPPPPPVCAGPPPPGHDSHGNYPKPLSHTTKTPVTYAGPGITGTASLPASLSAAIFPTGRVAPPYPSLGSGKLGQNVLPQSKSNGQSSLGTFDAPKLPSFLGNTASPWTNVGDPFGGRTASGTNPYTDPPNTGVVRSYHFDVARGYLAPDGVMRDMILINNQFPGPTIEADWGDTIEVTVTNNIAGPAEGVSFHWHGLLQTGTNYEDGVPGITQCPIAPGQTFTYSFKADLYGTSWWHSHFSAQLAGGAFGAMIIYGPNHVNYDKDLGPVLLSDYYHRDYYSILKDVMGTDLSVSSFASQNNLINGKGNYNCSLLANNATCTPNAGLAKFQFTSGQTHRLRLINGGAEALERFSIDGHVMEVIAYDFVPIVPYTTKQVTLGIGQRADVIVKATGNSTSSYWMRSTISATCSVTESAPGLAIIYYEHANKTAEPTSQSWVIDDSKCANDPLEDTVPYFALAPPAVDTTVDVTLSFEINSTGHFLWTLDGSTFRTDYNNPILPLLQANNATANINSMPREWNVYDFGSNKSFVIVVNNQNPVAHPMHIHGHNMFVLSQGVGTWDGTTQGSKLNPARRDVQLLPPKGHIAIQVNADNPGIWPFHCHIAWHVSAGLYMNILERPDLIPSRIKSPPSLAELCKTWDAWTSRDNVDMIDSGLRMARRDDALRSGLSPRAGGVRKHSHGHQHLQKYKVDHVRHRL